MKKVIVIGGPTASGKTGLAIELAKRYNTETINADSRQFYKYMNIGTAKPTPEEQSQAKHHFIDFLEPDEEYNAGRFEIDALKAISEIHEKNEYAIVVGGSGLYLRTLCEGMDALPETDPELREKYNQLYKDQGLETIQKLLFEKDPDYYLIVDIKNPHRIIRALEVIEQTGTTYSSLRKKVKAERPFKIIKIAIDISRDELYERINDRVNKMISAGLVDEVKNLVKYRDCNALKTVGYIDIFSYLDGTISIEEAIELIKKNSRNYAKRQMTWFNKDEEFHWFSAEEFDGIPEYIESQLE
ncbi:MAG: tRNA (adenosine(37)-N6)-dimethylallyltransferase MiaA [Bacteroidia bacterium]|nr:tRNA (adenosine(37)-N6)-dimethylallyltransferase MiaA [Bacteroidia bacterium]